MKLTFLIAVFAAALFAAELKVVSPPGATTVGPYSPGIWAGEFLYVSGQGARNKEGKFAASVEEQVADTLSNIQTILETAGLTMEHVVYTQVYMADVSQYERIGVAWRKYFPRNGPARATLGVYKMPTDTPVEITVVAIRDLSRKRAVNPPGWTAGIPAGVLAGDRLYLSGLVGWDPQTRAIPSEPAAQVQLALDRIRSVLTAAGMDFRNLVFVNPYLTDKVPMDVMNRIYAKHFEFGNTPARATIRVHGLPHGTNIEFTGVAIRDPAKRRAVRPKNMASSATASPCVWADDTLYCSAKAGFIPGPNGGIYAATVEHQVRQTMRNLLDGLEEAGLGLQNVVATNVYLDNLEEFVKMNSTYGQYFTAMKPTRTTVQPLAPVERKPDERGRSPRLEEISLIAVK
ncbi:MAG: RidA family protein [Acidobacteria bacterium]|nr:RidA family protein [Acidobacteriota bacterium]MBI3280555.1 RidA family protein [Acidobacteriota bacterium]